MQFFGKESGAVADLLSEDSSNIVQLIRQAYEVGVSHWLNIGCISCLLHEVFLGLYGTRQHVGFPANSGDEGKRSKVSRENS